MISVPGGIPDKSIVESSGETGVTIWTVSESQGAIRRGDPGSAPPWGQIERNPCRFLLWRIQRLRSGRKRGTLPPGNHIHAGKGNDRRSGGVAVADDHPVALEARGLDNEVIGHKRHAVLC